MGKIGNCCCETECCVDITAELPTITMSGMTASSWSGTGCCREMTLTPTSTPAWTCTKTSPIWTAEFKRDRTKEYHAPIVPYRREYLSNPCPLTQDHCCPQGEVLIGTVTESQTTSITVNYKVRYKLLAIIVKYSKQNVTCDGVEECRYVVQSTYRYSYQYQITKVTGFSASVTSTVESACFSLSDVAEQGHTFTVDEPAPTDDCTAWNNNSQSGITVLASGSGTIDFDRIKYYLAPPTGSISFSNTDLQVCSDTSCNTDGNYVTQVCIYSISNASTARPCWCAGVTQDFYDEECSLEAVNPCNGSGFGEYTIYTGCEGEEGCLVGFGTCFENDLPACDLYPAQCSEITLPDECDDPTRILYWTIGGVSSAIMECCKACGTTTCGQYPFQPFDCSDENNCDPDCCFQTPDCPNCNIFMTGCYTKFGQTTAWNSITEDTVTITCGTETQRSVCINAPTWTITLS